MAHKHAASMVLYAQDAMETPRPWERWELFLPNGCGWVNCTSNPSWYEHIEYRRKPKMLSVTLANGEVVSWPEPYTGALLLGNSYYTIGLAEVRQHNWNNSDIQQLIKEQGLLYLVKEDAEEALLARQLIFKQGIK